MATQEQAQENSQGASPEAPQTIKYEIGVNWEWRKLKIKAKMLEGENKWDTLQVLDAVATLLSKYRHNIPNISSNRLVASWVVSLMGSHECAGTLEITLSPYKEQSDLSIAMYIREIKDSAGEAWMVKSALANITCSTNKYTHSIFLYFDHNTLVDKYNDNKECSGECVENSLPSQVKVNKLYEIINLVRDAIPLIGWYTGKYEIISDDS
jgi:hypothetical protein